MIYLLTSIHPSVFPLLSLPSGHAIEDSRHYGWQVPEEVPHQWESMVEAIKNHIASLNWGYRTALRKKGVKYFNSYAEFVDPHTIKVSRALGIVCEELCDSHVALSVFFPLSVHSFVPPLLPSSNSPPHSPHFLL